MISMQDTSSIPGTQKLTRTCSLTDHSQFPYYKLHPLQARALPRSPSLEEYDISRPSSSVGVNSRLYVPYIPVPRGPRSTNLYLYIPTAADYAKARRRSLLREIAAEEARKERGDDERRRNIILGRTIPRKSTRKVKSRVDAPAAQGDCTSKVSPKVSQKRGSTGRRALAAKSNTQAEPLTDNGNKSTLSPSTSHISPPSSGETQSLSRKQQRKAHPKFNTRQTLPLTTRSVAKSKLNFPKAQRREANSLAGTHSQDGPLKARKLDINHDSFPEDSGGTDGLDGSTVNSEDYDSNSCSRFGSRNLSSDTLCDKFENNIVRAQSKSIPFAASDAPSSVSYSTSSMSACCDNSQTSISTTSTRTKRKSEIKDVVSMPSPQTQCRRSGRIPKKRKLQ